jgi:prolyl-tRNA synthetase
MLPEELELYIGGPAGYLGPVGIPQVIGGGSLNGLKSGKPIEKLKGVSRDEPSEGLRTIVILDPGLDGRKNLVAGANKLDYHFRNVTPGRDFTPTVVADIRNVNEGEPDPIAGDPLRIGKAVEVGHIFKLGCKYTESMGSRVLNADGKEVIPVMGCYGIGIERILTAAIESSAAKNAALSSSIPDLSSRPERSAVERPAGGAATLQESYALSPAIAPFHCVVTITNVRETDLLAAGERVAAALDAAGVDTLLDDRDERAGVKFKDAELIGIPYRINIGKKLTEGLVELVDRLTHTTTDLPIDSAAEHVRSLVASKS